MAQIQPRTFKFVGGPSRKRRRRNEIRSSTTNLPSPSTTTSRETDRTTKTQHQRHVSQNDGHDDHQQQPLPERRQQQPQQEQDAEAEDGASAIIQTTTTSPPQPPPNADPSVPTMTPSATDFDLLLWPTNNNTTTNMMNPFFGPGPMVGDFPTNQFQFPNFLTNDVDFSHTMTSPSTDELFDINRPNNGSEAQNAARVADHTVEMAMDSDARTMIPSPTIRMPRVENSFTEAWKRLIDRYNEEFCVLPLTNDFEANPFRHNLEASKGSKLLLHCILALSYKHVNRGCGSYSNEASHHKEEAAHLLREMELQTRGQDFEQTFLDAVLILMTLDCATSAHGPWLSYLHRAHRILDSAETLKIPKTPRMKAQIGMLVWWDVTLALTSRNGCVLSEVTILSQVKSDEATDPAFYNISGCPEDLFKHMVQLGTYAREYELASTMKCVTFDMAPVLAVEKSIRKWSAPEFGDPYEPGFDDEQSPGQQGEMEELVNYRQDLYHCAEAWRYGLLIYIERVFKWRSNKRTSPLLGFLARKTLNNVASCRKSLMLQKQLLLPVFLAGCETKDEVLQQEARDYCSWWSEETHYDMFLTAVALLEEVWNSKKPDTWWGSIIDEKTRTATGPVAKQYLFG